MAQNGTNDNEYEMSPLHTQNSQYSQNSQAFEESQTGPIGASPPYSPLIQISPANHHEFRTHLKLLIPWISTIALAIALIIVIKTYVAKETITSPQKNVYNFITTGLILFLGLSFYEAFKGLAKTLRPHLKHWFIPSADAQHRIENFDSLLQVFQLIISATGWGLKAFCAVWLLINLIAQIAATIINLTYIVDDGKDYNSTYVRNGQVHVSNLSCYWHGNLCAQNQVVTDTLAHAYGDSTLAADSNSTQLSDCGDFTDVSSIINSKQNFRYYCRRNTPVQEFGYRFKEYNPNDTQKVYPHFTDRVITAHSEKCNEYSQVDRIPARLADESTAWNFTYTDGSINGTIVIPTLVLGHDGTTYIYRGFHAPANAPRYKHGDRGVMMWAYRNKATSGQAPKFYECPITVSVVTNVRDGRHNITDEVAQEAAASIALQGKFQGTGENPDDRQWQFYANGHPWEIHNHDNSRVGANIAEHAIVSLAEMVARNPPIYMNGSVPYLGSKISVKWEYFVPLLACIVAFATLVVALSFLALRLTPFQRE